MTVYIIFESNLGSPGHLEGVFDSLECCFTYIRKEYDTICLLHQSQIADIEFIEDYLQDDLNCQSITLTTECGSELILFRSVVNSQINPHQVQY